MIRIIFRGAGGLRNRVLLGAALLCAPSSLLAVAGPATAQQSRVDLVPVAGGPARTLPGSSGRDLRRLRFAPDSSAVLALTSTELSGPFNFATTILRLPVDRRGGRPTRVRRFPYAIDANLGPHADRVAVLRARIRGTTTRATLSASIELGPFAGAPVARSPLSSRRYPEGVDTTWSPDGQRLVISRPPLNVRSRGRGALVVLDGRTGRVVRRVRTRTSAPGLTDFPFAPDSRTLLVEDDLGTSLRTLNVDSGAVAPVPGHRGHRHLDIAVSPVEPTVAAIGEDTRDRPPTLELFSLDGPGPVQRVAIAGAEGVAWTPDGTSVIVLVKGNRSDRILAVPVRPALGPPRELARYRSIDAGIDDLAIAPDGRTVAVSLAPR